NRRQTAEELVKTWPQLTAEEILESPYVLIGTVDEMDEALHTRRDRWGLSYFVTFDPLLEALAPIVARLAGKWRAQSDEAVPLRDQCSGRGLASRVARQGPQSRGPWLLCAHGARPPRRHAGAHSGSGQRRRRDEEPQSGHERAQQRFPSPRARGARGCDGGPAERRPVRAWARRRAHALGERPGGAALRAWRGQARAARRGGGDHQGPARRGGGHVRRSAPSRHGAYHSSRPGPAAVSAHHYRGQWPAPPHTRRERSRHR